MSFSSDAKRELCRDRLERRDAAVAECYGVLLPAKEAAGDSLVKSYFAHLDEVFESRSRSDLVVREALNERNGHENK